MNNEEEFNDYISNYLKEFNKTSDEIDKGIKLLEKKIKQLWHPKIVFITKPISNIRRRHSI